MRRLIYAINVSADGCCDHAAFRPGDGVLDYFTRLTRESGTLLYGRKTYELMVPYWPEIARNPSANLPAEHDFALAFVAVPEIVVVSGTLPDAAGVRIVRGGLREEILRLKREPGRDILTGGVSLPGELLALGLVDELRIVLHPVVAGQGKRLFDDLRLPENLPLTLMDAQPYPSGFVALRYATGANSS